MLKSKLKDLQKHEEELEKHLEHLENHKNELKRDHIYARYAYVTYEDLEFLNKNHLLKTASDDSDADDSDDHGIRSIDDREDDIEASEHDREMILAIRAPYGSTLEIPLEAQIKEMQALALKNRQDFQNRISQGDERREQDIIEREEYEDMLRYLEKKYQIFINSKKASSYNR
jgi:hypothetical protein